MNIWRFYQILQTVIYEFMVLSLRYKPDIGLHKKPLMQITCKTSYGKQFRDYRAKGCK